MFRKKISTAIGLIFALFFLVGCKQTVISRAAINSGSLSATPTPTPTASPSPTPTPGPSAAAPTCTMQPFLSSAGGYQNPGVMITAILRVTGGVATRVAIGVVGGDNALVTLPYPVTSLFTVTPLVRTEFIGVVEGPGGRSTCGMTVNIVLPNLFPACNGAAAAYNPYCYGDIAPMAAGMGSYLTYRDEDVVRSTVETRGYCSIWRSGVVNPKYKWLANAVAPILSVYDAANGMPLATYDLRFMQNDPNRALGLAIDMSPLIQMYGDAWRARRVRISVCDNVEQAGIRTFSCFDKDIAPSVSTHGPRLGISHRIGTAQWSEMSTEFLAGSIPANFQMGLWWKENATPDNDVRCKVRQSPLVINFDEAAPETLSSADGPLFDMVGNGVKKKTSWIAPNSGKAGFLVLNPGDGTPLKVHHLFGNRTLMPNGQLPAADHPNGFLALALYDSNRDGKISSLDAVWPKLRIWFDENANGLRDGVYELKTMAEAGVVEIPLANTPVALTDANGVSIYQMGMAMVSKPGVGLIPRLVLDYWFTQQ